VTPVADVGIGKTGSATVPASSNLVYTISSDELRSIQRQQRNCDRYVASGRDLRLGDGGGVNTSGVVSWSLGTLTSGQVSNITVTVTAPASGTLTNTASASSPTVDPNSTNNITSPSSRP